MTGLFDRTGKDTEYHRMWAKHGQKLRKLRKTKKHRKNT